MAIAKMEKINIIFPTKIKGSVLNLLQEEGVLQIESFGDDMKSKYNINKSIDKCVDCEYMIAESQFAINFLEKYKVEEKKSLITKIREGKYLKINRDKYNQVINNFDYKAVIEQCKKLEEKINFHQNKLRELEMEKEDYFEWASLNINFSRGLDTENTKAVIGTIKSSDYQKFKDLLSKADKNFSLHKIDSNSSDIKIVLIYIKHKEKEFKKILNSVGFVVMVFNKMSGTVKDEIKKIEQEILDHKAEINKFIAEAKNIAKEQDNLKIIFDHYNTSLEKHMTSKKAINMSFVSVMQAWVTTDHLDETKTRLKDLSDQISVVLVKTEKDEQAPVKLNNNNIIEPFESVTNIYGLPKSNEVDPTAWLSLSFLIFFGFCLSDAGYGLIMTFLAVLAIKVLKIPRENQTLIRLIAYAGVFTFIIGALFGGWFGINLDTLAPGVISNFLLKIRVINPITEPLTLMFVAFAIGFVHILFGIFVKFYQSWRDNKKMDALLDSGLWLVFLPILAYWAIVATELSKILVLTGVVVLILTQGRKKKGIFGKFFSGLLSLYGLVGYFSDILSYSRLLALGLATGVIAMIVNQIGGLANEMIPYVGWLVMIIIIIGGHIFNLAINILGSFIHSSRLEFVEFFGKFLEGGGTMFEPFNKKFKYIVVK